ncbi:MAG: hypothetical protein AAF937_01775 [Planctomycetota bacterium]
MPARRGLQDIRSYAGRDTSPGAEHKKYVRLSVLEMERARRQHEYEAARSRADMALARVQRLEGEIAEIIDAVRGVSGTAAAECDSNGEVHRRVEVKHTYGARRPRPDGGRTPRSTGGSR